MSETVFRGVIGELYFVNLGQPDVHLIFHQEWTGPEMKPGEEIVWETK